MSFLAASTDWDAGGGVEIADLPQRQGPVTVTLYTMAEVDCDGCRRGIKVRDDQKGVKRAERFLAKHQACGTKEVADANR